MCRDDICAENHNFSMYLLFCCWCDFALFEMLAARLVCWQLASRPGTQPRLSPGSREREYYGKIDINEMSRYKVYTIRGLTLAIMMTHTMVFPVTVPVTSPAPWSWHRTLVHMYAMIPAQSPADRGQRQITAFSDHTETWRIRQHDGGVSVGVE